ncbi:glucosyl-3-phosphoglycerate synthase [Prauserella muralis]|uniref:Glucosyl-3-phosphoglycerate synthase n=1 Tax=Prauserella muralis TaxID=588067 RepID=A0A2V4AJ16_9PSEU|nr:glucosyl-3-phosphoglycerate synthase [Prauserella muralis]PXY19166.1 glucosyl-3-phosphoglycerate synthase [Prauserella muralis]TWE29077.1 glucosyl-3-phosphoglycerate synthase [Prauserella muralis]
MHATGTGLKGAGHAVPAGVGDWLARRSSRADDWTAAELAAAKRGRTVSVVIPARDEQETVGEIVRTIRDELMERTPLVDEVLVVDSHSRDATAAVAAEAGATVVAQDAVLHPLPGVRGKGEALWKGLAATTGELVVFVDADLYDFTAGYVIGLLGPLLSDPGIDYVKGFYHRPLAGAERSDADGGGRVTELVARPLLNLFWPELAGFVQPLAGEYAGRREVLERIPFVTHYGVEMGHLIDLVEWRGLDALAQVDLGIRTHRHQGTQALGRMSGQIMLTILDRLDTYGRLVTAEPPATLLAQFRRGAGVRGVERELVLTDVSLTQRPPLASLHSDPMAAMRDSA